MITPPDVVSIWNEACAYQWIFVPCAAASPGTATTATSAILSSGRIIDSSMCTSCFGLSFRCAGVGGGLLEHKRKRPTSWEVGRLTDGALAMTYFLTGNPQYHRRGVVSRSCSGWEGVGPTRYGRQEFWNEGSRYWTRHCIVAVIWEITDSRAARL